MIWVAGKVVPDDALTVSVLDRTFEHGLGLFETLRTWGGRAPLLERHLARMSRSAQELGLPLDPARLPTPADVAHLLDVESLGTDRVLRITMSGGDGSSEPAMVWMRSLPLPAPARPGGASVDVGSWRVCSEDPIARHKSLNYWARRLSYERAGLRGFDESIGDSGMAGARLVWEGTRTNLFAIHDKRLTTPTTIGPVVPGIMRRLVLERAADLDLEIVEDGTLSLAMLAGADEVFLTNSVRGLIPVARLHDSEAALDPVAWEAPGPSTSRLALAVNDWLQAGGDTP
jgi:branched-subunit amino acid aminotransferase/4-amino-4-deoxychorismate lyase